MFSNTVMRTVRHLLSSAKRQTITNQAMNCMHGFREGGALGAHALEEDKLITHKALSAKLTQMSSRKHL